MLLPARYPLVEDFGKPLDDPGVRRRWAQSTRRALQKHPLRAFWCVLAGQTFFGTVGWLLQRFFSPSSLYSHLASRMPMGNAHLGAEYYNIAAAVARGDGFSDPFVAGSGATAWMPPLLVWIQAAFIWLFGGDRFLVMLAVLTLKTIVLAGCGLMVLRQGRRVSSRWLAFGVVTFYFVAEFTNCFAHTHDSWLILGIVTATVFGLVWISEQAVRKRLTLKQSLPWGLLGGAAALSSPVAGFTWAVGTTWALIRHQPKHWIIAGLVSVVVIMPWTIRNRVSLGKWIPIKSNVYFEFDQSQTLDSDGLLDFQTMSAHPYHVNEEQAKYLELGEVEYLETKKQRFWNSLRESPDAYWTKVKNRLMGVTLNPAGFSTYRFGGPSLPLRWLSYPVPFVAVMVLLLRRLVHGRALSLVQQSAILVYAAYLFPYVLCSYYPRYGLPLLTVKMLLVFWLIQALVPKRFAMAR
ncbi:MAG: hypothetical protein AAGA03_00350 [Planctomycetota bacterium]